MAGERAPTIADVARRAGVSIATASRVITGTVPVTAERSERVLRAASELHYVPNERARELRRGSLRAVGFLAEDLSDPYFAGIYHHVRRRLDDARCALIAIEASPETPATSEMMLPLLRSDADAMVAAESAIVGADVLDGLDRRHVRTIRFDGSTPGTQRNEHLVRIDDRAGMALLTRYLIEIGHRRIALVGGPTRRATDRERRAGYAATLSDAGLEELVVQAPGWTPDDAAHAAAGALERAERPTALIALDPRGAAGVLDVARGRGLDVPGDLSVASFYSDEDMLGHKLTSLGDVREMVASLIARALAAPVDEAGDDKPVLTVDTGSTSAPPRGR